MAYPGGPGSGLSPGGGNVGMSEQEQAMVKAVCHTCEMLKKDTDGSPHSDDDRNGILRRQDGHVRWDGFRLGRNVRAVHVECMS